MKKANNTMKRYLLLFTAVLYTALLSAQDIDYARKTINTLCSPKYNGRGYVKNGDAKAAAFIYKELKKLKGVEVQYQAFAFPVNTFPGKMKVKVDEQTLEPGIDYIVDPACPSIKGKYDIKLAAQSTFESDDTYKNFAAGITANTFIVIDTLPALDKEIQARVNELKGNAIGAAGVIILTNKKLTWSVATEQNKFAEITLTDSKFNRSATQVVLDIKAELIPRHTTNNVLGFIKGTTQPDSIITLTAHYDHLGRMGKETYFPGANDNASGTALLLDMAHYYSTHPQPYSILFIAFAAEEAGLIGSNYYVNADPIYPLEKMKFLINMDLMATGEKGIMAVNGLVFEDEYKALENINKEKNYLPVVQARGKAANSDHYFFSEKGVHCFFFYLMGDFPSYHDPGDKAEIVPLTEYEDTFRLITDFITYLQK
jgi:aminopeptidase YwaD